MEIPSLDSIKGVLNQGADLLARGANAITQGATVSAARSKRPRASASSASTSWRPNAA
ncbi:MAG: hypothetical protein J6V65_02745 [Fibrobacterales bacterium]|nr:hypothetical protein [Fibrobacterales bacterium]